MAHASSIFHSVPVEVQNSSGFDLSFDNLLTATCGTLTPCLSKEVIPGTKFSIGTNWEMELPPMVSNFFGRIDGIVELFFVPYRILYGGWKRFFTQSAARVDDNPIGIPSFAGEALSDYFETYSGLEGSEGFGEGSLSDYLGNRFADEFGQFGVIDEPISIMKYMAYHKIYNDWYRNTRIQKEVFDMDSGDFFASMPYRSYSPAASLLTNVSQLNDGLNDGSLFYALRQRNYAKDYFTNAAPHPQQGSTPVSFTFSGSSFTINGLRAANSLAKFVDINNLAGNEYDDLIYAQFGVRPADAITDRAIYLGRSIAPVYTRGVFTSTPNSANVPRNPFSGSVGNPGGAPSVSGSGSLVDSFKVTEYGCIMAIFSLVPHAYYGYGVRRENMHTQIGDFGFPVLQGMGMQEIKTAELYSTGLSNSTFGYTDRYSEFKYIDDEVHGEFRPGRTLEYFALQRKFNAAPQLGTQFIQINKSDLNGVFVGSPAVTFVSCWGHIGFTFKSSMPLAEYSIPTLGETKDTHTIRVENGGRML